MSPWEWLARKVTKVTHKKDISKICSEEAGEKIDRAYWRNAVLEEFKKGPAIADEIAFSLCADILTIRPRVTELRKAGLLIPTGQRRSNDKGNKCAVLALYDQV